MNEVDIYTKGMGEFEEREYDATDKLTLFEHSLFGKELGTNVLEVGAGWGRLTSLVHRKDSPAEYVAIEPSPVLFAKMKSRLSGLPGLDLKSCEVGDLKAEFSGHFDSVFSVHVMEHVEDDRRFVEDSLALLKPGGKLIVLVPALQFLYSDLDKNIGHFRRYDKAMIRTLFSGLDVRMDKLFYSNFLGVLASLYFLKFKKLEYQSEGKKQEFTFLVKIYDRYVIPIIAAMERLLPIPVGLNLTVIVTKK